jgi:hypothetical protein
LPYKYTSLSRPRHSLTLTYCNRSDPPAMEKKNAVAIVMEKKDVVASVPAADGV